MLPVQLSTSFQSFQLLPTRNLGPSGVDSRVGGFVYALEQGCQTHFHQGPHQPRGCLQRAECNFRTP